MENKTAEQQVIYWHVIPQWWSSHIFLHFSKFEMFWLVLAFVSQDKKDLDRTGSMRSTRSNKSCLKPRSNRSWSRRFKDMKWMFFSFSGPLDQLVHELRVPKRIGLKRLTIFLGNTSTRLLLTGLLVFLLWFIGITPSICVYSQCPAGWQSSKKSS